MLLESGHSERVKRWSAWEGRAWLAGSSQEDSTQRLDIIILEHARGPEQPHSGVTVIGAGASGASVPSSLAFFPLRRLLPNLMMEPMLEMELRMEALRLPLLSMEPLRSMLAVWEDLQEDGMWRVSQQHMWQGIGIC